MIDLLLRFAEYSDIQFPIVISNAFPLSFRAHNFLSSFRAQQDRPQMRMILRSRETCFSAGASQTADSSTSLGTKGTCCLLLSR